MRRSDSIFDSRAERAVFESLDSRFGGAGRLVPQLPLSKLIELDGQDVLTAAEVGFFYKTNVDFTFADEDGRPLFSIEFDGIGGGYSRAGIYVPQRPTGDPRREWKFDFKLRLAREVGYPLLILSFDEAGPLADGESLTVLDGIVGHLLANTKAPEIIRERLAEGQHELDQYDDDLRFEMAQDLVWGPRSRPSLSTTRCRADCLSCKESLIATDSERSGSTTPLLLIWSSGLPVSPPPHRSRGGRG